MKCKQCNHELVANAKFCPECGAKQALTCASCGASLNSDAKFCGECGAKVEAKPDAGWMGQSNVVTSIPVSPLPFKLPDCHVAIQEVTAEGPDEDGDLRVTVKYTVTNTTESDWEYLDVRTHLFNAAGLIMDESRDGLEMSVGAGDSAECESRFWRVKASLFDDQIDKAHVVISLCACGIEIKKLGEIAIPEAPYETATIEPIKLKNEIQLIAGNLWKTEPDDDKDSRIEIKAFVQNLTEKHLPEVRLIAQVTDKHGREITDASSYDEVRPGSLTVITGSGLANEKKLNSSKVELTIRAYLPVAVGVAQFQGFSVTATDLESDDEIDDQDEDEDEDEDDIEPTDIVTIRFAMTKGEGNWPEIGDMSADERKDPTLIARFNLNWDPDASEDVEDVEIEKCEVIYDGVSYLENMGLGLHIEGNTLSGHPSPVIRFKLSREVDPNKFKRAIWTSSIRLLPESKALSDEEGFYCEDYNGYTSVLNEEDLDEVIEAVKNAGINFGKSFSPDQLSEGIAVYDIRKEGK